MIKITIKIILIIIIHLTIFVLYPDTGKNGHNYLYASIGIWSFLAIYTSINLKLFNVFPISIITNILFYILMIFVLLITVPQEDKKSILVKIKKGIYPKAEDIQRGKIKFINSFFNPKINLPEMKPALIEKETKKILKKIKEN